MRARRRRDDGHVRTVVNGKPSFHEFLHLAEENVSLVMKLKHLNEDLTAWEEKDGKVREEEFRMERQR
ncbi:MAG TPA: DUF6265 family protein [Vicinamibacterales bacterium]|nr:DUF6265 family protein [Vicinamibacterales bacterium]